MIRRALKVLYFLWLAGFLVLFWRRHYEEGFAAPLPSAAAVAIILALLLLLIAVRNPARSIVDRLPLTPGVKFVVLGVGFALIAEALYTLTPEPIDQRLLVDWLIEAPFYTAIYATWWAVLRRYRYSLWELFFLAGIAGALIEGNVKLLASPLAFLFVPHAIAVHGALIVPAAYAVAASLNQSPRSNRRLRYLIAMLPALWLGPFLIWLLFLKQIVGI